MMNNSLVIDGIVGDVLFWSIQKVIGEEAYTQEVHHAWIHIYSRLLKVIVPIAVEAELHDKDNDVSKTKRQEACIFTTMKVHTGEPTTVAPSHQEARDSELVGSQKMIQGL